MFGKHKFRLIHDSFFFDRRVLKRFLNYFKSENSRFEWGCSVKPDLLNPALIDDFIAAGCRGMFLGIESASPVVQRRIGKIMDLKRVSESVEYAVSRGLGLITSFIIGFPFETTDDLQRTLNYHKRMVDIGVFRSMVNTLCPLPASELRRLGNAIRYDECPPNLSDAGWMIDEEARDLIRRHPSLFSSFYRYELQYLDQADVAAAFYVANNTLLLPQSSFRKYLTNSDSDNSVDIVLSVNGIGVGFKNC